MLNFQYIDIILIERLTGILLYLIIYNKDIL